MRRPVDSSDIIEDWSEQAVVADPVVKHVHETGDVTMIGDVESRLLHVTLLSIHQTSSSSFV